MMEMELAWWFPIFPESSSKNHLMLITKKRTRQGQYDDDHVCVAHDRWDDGDAGSVDSFGGGDENNEEKDVFEGASILQATFLLSEFFN